MALSTIRSKFDLPRRFRDASYSVWTEFVDLVASHKPLNLGQGFPDYSAADYIPSVLSEVSATDSLVHQYTRGFLNLLNITDYSRAISVIQEEPNHLQIHCEHILELPINRKQLTDGHPRLVKAISELYSKLIDRPINPLTEVLITCGAYEALYSSLGGLIEDGDEVVIIEPFYDCYEPIVRIFGGIPRFVPLRNTNENLTEGTATSASWKLNPKELEDAFGEKTKVIILNTPHNPTGKVFTTAELELIAGLCKKFNVICLSDEVYEWLVYKPAVHVRIATLPGMWERTITVASAGKTFSVTGWKCGWLYGPDYLVRNASIAHQNNVYTYNTPIQEALAICFEKETRLLNTPQCYFQNLPEKLKPKRDAFMQTLRDAGYIPTVPEAGYFVLADWSKLAKGIDLSSETDPQKDYRFAKWMTKNVKLLGIPPSAFYSQEHKNLASNFIRYCFFKKDETLQQARDILLKWKNNSKL